MPAPTEVHMPASAPAKSAVQLVFQVAMVAQRVLTCRRVRQYPSRLPRQSSHCGVRRYAPAMRRLASYLAHRLSRDRRHNFQQMPRARITVKRARHLPDVPGKVR